MEVVWGMITDTVNTVLAMIRLKRGHSTMMRIKVVTTRDTINKRELMGHL